MSGKGIPEHWFDAAAQEIFEHITTDPHTFKLRRDIRDILYDIQMQAHDPEVEEKGWKDITITRLLEMGEARIAAKMMKEWDI